MVNTTFGSAWKDFLTLIYPSYCFACENYLVKGEDIICTKCLLNLPKTDFHLDQKNVFFRKLEGRIKVKYVLAQFLFSKQGNIQNLLHNLKYRNHPEIGVLLGKQYGAELLKSKFHQEFDLILPVPLHPSRLRKRGYNQSFEFGKGLSELLEIPCEEGIVTRITKTESQTRRTKLKRWQNVNEVFKLVKPDKVTNKRILLVDDVVTTGATIEACGHTILEGGCLDLSIACIAATK